MGPRTGKHGLGTFAETKVPRLQGRNPANNNFQNALNPKTKCIVTGGKVENYSEEISLEGEEDFLFFFTNTSWSS
jgi:hypothetical protein